MCFLAQVSVLGAKFDRPLGRTLRATFMVGNDCAVLVIFTFAVDKVETAHGCKVVHEQGIIPHLIAKRFAGWAF